VTKLQHDTITQGLVSLETANIRSVKLIGGKAANFSELMKINAPGYGKLPLPEGAFAIPFYYYWQHLRNHSLDDFISRMLHESRFQTDFQYRKEQLIRLQDSITALPIDPALLALVNARIHELDGYVNIRFRSSTNSEDIKGFNGAGL
jgi:phosphoenolpyruvate synthase/pyruvate phosphate dikinase